MWGRYEEEKWFVYKSNVYESVINLMRELVSNNESDTLCFVRLNGLSSSKNDLEKPPEEANKVASGALLSSDLRKMALGMTTRGHIYYMISQVRSKVSLILRKQMPESQMLLVAMLCCITVIGF